MEKLSVELRMDEKVTRSSKTYPVTRAYIDVLDKWERYKNIVSFLENSWAKSLVDEEFAYKLRQISFSRFRLQGFVNKQPVEYTITITRPDLAYWSRFDDVRFSIFLRVKERLCEAQGLDPNHLREIEDDPEAVRKYLDIDPK